MNIDNKQPTGKGASELFTGNVWVDPIAQPHTENQRMVVSRVRFAPGEEH